MMNLVAHVGVAYRTVSLVLCGAALAATAHANEPAAPAGTDQPLPPFEFEVPAGPATNPVATVAATTNAAPAPAESEHAMPKVPTNALEGVNAALRDSADLTTNANLTHSVAPTPIQVRLEELQILLDLARRYKREKNITGAAEMFEQVLASEAAAELKRTALLEMALMAQQESQLTKAQRMFTQYVRTFPEDPSVPEILLRQGLLYREMGAPVLALSKFYGVMTTALALKLDKVGYYQELVLKAQTEIADTYYLQGKYDEAADFFVRLLKLESPQLNQRLIQFKLIRSLAALGRHDKAIAQAKLFLETYPQAREQPEVRFLLASALKKNGRNHDALEQVKHLLESQEARLGQNAGEWVYWQQRAGNDIANDLYKEGDYMGALTVYLGLVDLNTSPAWQFPVQYQIGLVYEKLRQPDKASESYNGLIEREKELGATPSPSLQALIDMARWRKNYLTWHTQAEHASRQMTTAGTEKTSSPATP